MITLQQLLRRSETSSFHRFIFHRAISYAVPFNGPRHFRMLPSQQGSMKIMLPYRRSNLNHLKGIHACALATLCEFTAGMAMLAIISEKEYRFILKSLTMKYHYQARKDVIALFSLDQGDIQKRVIQPLQNQDAVFITHEVAVHDTDGNEICTGITEWQLKKWKSVNKKN